MPILEYALEIMQSPAAHSLGLTLIHFIWQGAAWACVLWLLLRWTDGRRPTTRYAVSCLTLAIMVASPLLTWLYLTATAVHPAAELGLSAAQVEPWAAASAVPDTGVASATQPVEGVTRSPFPSVLSIIAALWSMGVVLLLSRLVGGWAYACHRIRTYASPAADGWQRRLVSLVADMGIRQRVRLLVSDRLRQVHVIGWIRPVIVWPAAMLAAMPPVQVEAILLHELAHIRRNDYLVNVLQSVAETLLFYHPAVWWVSERIRAEREHDCDDRAAKRCGSVHVYARALATLEQLRIQSPVPVVGASGSDLAYRVRRLLGTAPDTEAPTRGLLAAAAILLVASVSFVSCSDLTVTEPVDPSAVAPDVELSGEIAAMLADDELAALIDSLHALRRAGDELALDVTLAAYRDARDPQSRSSIVHVLSHFFTPEADASLGRIARQDPSEDVRYHALWAFSFRLSGLGLKNPGLLTVADLREAEARRAQNRGRNASAVPLFEVIALDEDEQPRVRGAALRSLRASGAGEASFYREVYRSTRDPQVRSSALRQLGFLGNSAFPMLADVIESETDVSIVRSALRALGWTRHPSAVELATRVARTADDTGMRWSAVGALRLLDQHDVGGAEEAIETLRSEGIRVDGV